MRAQRVRHCMIDAESDIGESHAGYILRQRHSFAPFRFSRYGVPQAL